MALKVLSLKYFEQRISVLGRARTFPPSLFEFLKKVSRKEVNKYFSFRSNNGKHCFTPVLLGVCCFFVLGQTYMSYPQNNQCRDAWSSCATNNLAGAENCFRVVTVWLKNMCLLMPEFADYSVAVFACNGWGWHDCVTGCRRRRDQDWRKCQSRRYYNNDTLPMTVVTTPRARSVWGCNRDLAQVAFSVLLDSAMSRLREGKRLWQALSLAVFGMVSPTGDGSTWKKIHVHVNMVKVVTQVYLRA